MVVPVLAYRGSPLAPGPGPSVPISAASAVPAPDETGPEQEQERLELGQVLKSVVDDLPAQERIAVGLVYSEGLPPEEVAAVLGLTVQKLQVVLGEALGHLRKCPRLAQELG